METNPNAALTDGRRKDLQIKVFGVGNAGITVSDLLISRGLPPCVVVAINTDPQELDQAGAAEKLLLETRVLRGLGSGGDPERGSAVAEEHSAKLKSLCEGIDVVVLVAGLGGGTGTGISPVLARVAKEQGALVLGLITLPFDCEGTRRQELAQEGLQELKEAADGVICLPNQKVFKLIDENTSALDTFKLINELLADAVRGLWRLLTYNSLIEIHFENLCELLRDRHTKSAFAVAEAMGATRSREVVDKLLQHPLLDGGELMGRSQAVLVSLIGGPDLAMAEINRVMNDIKAKCPNAQLIMGAALDPGFHERLAVMLVATYEAPGHSGPEGVVRGQAEQFEGHLLDRSSTVRPGSRFVPPPPVLPPEEVRQLLARQGRGGRLRKISSKMRQGQLPLEIISKGRFDKSEPTIYKGEDLDVPTYIRRGVSLELMS
jgi:cell division protein FtsZ